MKKWKRLFSLTVFNAFFSLLMQSLYVEKHPLKACVMNFSLNQVFNTGPCPIPRPTNHLVQASPIPSRKSAIKTERESPPTTSDSPSAPTSRDPMLHCPPGPLPLPPYPEARAGPRSCSDLMRSLAAKYNSPGESKLKLLISSAKYET